MNEPGQVRAGAMATFPAYLGASVVALGADMGSFMAVLKLGMPAMPAAATGYGLGIVVHWLLSSRLVFAGGIAAAGSERLRQQLLFLISALLGLAITTGLVGAGAALGADPRLAKIAAIGVSFVATWLVRQKFVFSARETP